MTDQEPYKSPTETSSKPKPRVWSSLILCCAAGLIAGGIPFAYGSFMYASVFFQEPPPPGTGACGSGALLGLLYMVIVAPVCGLGTLIFSLTLRRVFS